MLNPYSSQKGHRPAANCLRVEEQCHLLNSCEPMVMNSTTDHHLKMPVAPATSSEIEALWSDMAMTGSLFRLFTCSVGQFLSPYITRSCSTNDQFRRDEHNIQKTGFMRDEHNIEKTGSYMLTAVEYESKTYNVYYPCICVAATARALVGLMVVVLLEIVARELSGWHLYTFAGFRILPYCRLLTYKPWADVSPKKKKAVLRQSSNRL